MTFWRELEKCFDTESDGFGAGVFCRLAARNTKNS